MVVIRCRRRAVVAADFRTILSIAHAIRFEKIVRRTQEILGQIRKDLELLGKISSSWERSRALGKDLELLGKISSSWERSRALGKDLEVLGKISSSWERSRALGKDLEVRGILEDSPGQPNEN
jgi:hypothetical protein